MDYIYAQLDCNDMCTTVSIHNGELNAENVVRIDEYDEGLLGKKYNRATGEFIELPPIPSIAPIDNDTGEQP